MQKRFVAIREDMPSSDWLARFVAGRAETEAWYRGTGRGAPPTAAECAAQLQRHMPELLGPYERVCALVGEDDLARQILSQYRPPPLPHGCTQAVWLGDQGPALVRNYDYPLDVVSDHFESTRWFGREVISKGARQQAALRTLESSGTTLGKLVETFLTPPIYSRDQSSPTVYSAVYRPATLTVDYLWPGNVMTRQIGSFRPGQYVHDYGALTT